MKKVLIYTDDKIRMKFFYEISKCFLNEMNFIFLTSRLSIFLLGKILKLNIHLLKKEKKQYISEDKVKWDNINDIVNGLLNKKCACNFLNSIYAFIIKNNIKLCFCWGWFCDTLNELLEEKVKFLFFELANLPGKTFIDNEGANARSSLYKNPEKLDTLFCKEIENFSSFVEEFKKIKGNKNYIPPQAKENIKEKVFFLFDIIFSKIFKTAMCFQVRFNYFKKKFHNNPLILQYDNIEFGEFIFVPLQVCNDSQVIINSDYTVDNFLKKVLGDYKDEKVVVKIHPAEKDIECIKKILSLKKDYIFFISNENTYELIKKAKKVITLNSTVGLEAMILGKEVIFYGRSFYKFFSCNRLKAYISCYLLDIDPFKIDNFERDKIRKKIFNFLDIKK